MRSTNGLTNSLNSAMKKLFVLVSCFLLLSCSHHKPDEPCMDCDEPDEPFECIDCCECSEPPKETYAWDYPAKPDTDEWIEFNRNRTSQEIRKALEIPEEILFSLSTEDLTGICVQYPFLYPFGCNYLINCVDNLYDTFNGIRELLKRKEASEEILKHYNCLLQDISILDTAEPLPTIQGFYLISVDIMEFLLGFYTFKADNLSKNDYQKMLQSLLCGYEKEFEHYLPNYPNHFYYNFYARANVIHKISPKSLENKPYYYDGTAITYYEQKAMDFINELSYQLIK